MIFQYLNGHKLQKNWIIHAAMILSQKKICHCFSLVLLAFENNAVTPNIALFHASEFSTAIMKFCVELWENKWKWGAVQV